MYLYLSATGSDLPDGRNASTPPADGSRNWLPPSSRLLDQVSCPRIPQKVNIPSLPRDYTSGTKGPASRLSYIPRALLHKRVLSPHPPAFLRIRQDFILLYGYINYKFTQVISTTLRNWTPVRFAPTTSWTCASKPAFQTRGASMIDESKLFVGPCCVCPQNWQGNRYRVVLLDQYGAEFVYWYGPSLKTTITPSLVLCLEFLRVILTFNT